MRETRAERWARWIAEQVAGGESIRAFCRRQGIRENSFYWWRRRLHDNHGGRFAVVETHASPVGASMETALELVLANGERLRIARGVDAATLRLALDTIRA